MSKYDGLEVLENSSKYGGYTQITNYSNAFAYRIGNAGIVSVERMLLAMDMLTFRHNGESPFTSQDTFAKRFGCSVKSIKAAIKDLKDSCLINVSKSGRKNVYDLSPLLKCLASFVEHIHNGVDVCIKTLVKKVLAGEYVPEMVKEEEKKPEPVFDEIITNELDKLSEEDRKSSVFLIEKHKHKMSSESIAFYIEGAVGKERFGGYLRTCLENGSDEDVRKRKEESAKPKPKSKQQYSKNPVRQEMNPDWLQKQKEENETKEEQRKLFTRTYGTHTQERYKDIHSEEAFEHQGSFIAWFNTEVAKYGSKEAFESWCLEEARRKLMEMIGRKSA